MTVSISSPQIAPTVYTFDGAEFDLSLDWVDVFGRVYRHTGQWNERGEPLMAAVDERNPSGPPAPPMPWDNDVLPLPDVYRNQGPLIPASRHPQATRPWARLIGGAA